MDPTTVLEAMAVAEKDIAAADTWPRLRDLPEDEREPFAKWMEGQTFPIHPDFPESEQDFYYAADYRQWKAGRRPLD